VNDTINRFKFGYKLQHSIKKVSNGIKDANTEWKSVLSKS